MKRRYPFVLSALAAVTVLGGIQARADDMASIAIAPATGVVTLAPHWAIGGNLAGFHHMAQDLSLGGEANDFYSIKGTTIPAGGDIAAFTLYAAASGAATNHSDIGSKLTPNSYSALTSADPDIGYGSVNFYFIHHKSTGDYFTTIVPGSGTSSAVTDLKPMSGPGGPSTLGAPGYFGLTFAAANLGYGLNLFYYLRTDPVTGFTRFGSLEPALLGTSADHFDLGIGGYKALAFTGTDVGYGTDKMYYVRLDPITGFTILGTLHPLTGRAADIANLGSVYSTLTFVPGDVGFGSGRFYTTGAVNPTWQSVSFAAIADRKISDGSFTVSPSASSGLPIALTVVTGSASISGPVGGVFTVTPTAPGRITLQATQAGQVAPTPYEFNMLRQGFLVTAVPGDLSGDGKPDLIWRNQATGADFVWLMNGTSAASFVSLPTVMDPNWRIEAEGDFNGDGKMDLVWRNQSTGAGAIWIMSGTSASSFVSLPTVADTHWRIVGAEDFNADGKTDLVWRNYATGATTVWYMNGSGGATSGGTFATVADTSWQIVGVGHFNDDRRPDLVWRNRSTGANVIWLMTGTAASSVAILPSLPDSSWFIEAVADLDGNGTPDLVWRNQMTGVNAIWLMNGTTVSGPASLPTVGDTNWRIEPSDF